jgi:hypothetical protein
MMDETETIKVHRGLASTFRWLAIGALIVLAGCNSQRGRARAPGIDASRAGQQALEMYDKNHDGLIAGDELDQAPALKEALPRLDTNGDKAVSADEITARVKAWQATQIGLASIRCHVSLDGEPLPGATVTFEPEPFLGTEIKPAVGISNPFGDAAPVIPKEQRSDPSEGSGAHLGLYKVRISKVVNGKETIPSRYNTDTILGQEVAYDDPAIQRMSMNFALKSGK